MRSFAVRLLRLAPFAAPLAVLLSLPAACGSSSTPAAGSCASDSDCSSSADICASANGGTCLPICLPSTTPRCAAGSYCNTTACYGPNGCNPPPTVGASCPTTCYGVCEPGANPAAGDAASDGSEQ